jgi:hypothetical protein
MFAFSSPAQTKFIKEYHYTFIVDKGVSAQTLDKLVDYANSALKNVDKDGYGLRIVNDGIQDTSNLGNDYTTVKQDIEKLRKTEYLGYISNKSIIDKKGVSYHGSRTNDKRGFFVVFEDTVQSGYVVAHEFLHNTGADHSPASLNINTCFLADDLMSKFPAKLNPYVYPGTKKMIWEKLTNTQFYDFNVEE